jgi:hypothetical protein
MGHPIVPYSPYKGGHVMASSIKDKRGNYLVSFRWAGKQHTKSLRTRDAKDAAAGVKRIEVTLSAIRQGWMLIPDDADPAEFIISGGTRTAKPTTTSTTAVVDEPTTLADLFDRWREGAKKRPNTLRTILIHQKHVKCAPESGHESGGAYRTCTHALAERFSFH